MKKLQRKAKEEDDKKGKDKGDKGELKDGNDVDTNSGEFKAIHKNFLFENITKSNLRDVRTK